MTHLVLCTVVNLLALNPLHAAPKPPPAPAAAVVADTSATITGIEGMVQFRTADDQPWQKPTLDTKLPLTATVRVGPRSAIRLRTDTDRIVTIDRLGTATVGSALDNTGIKTVVGLPYGRTRFDIEAAGIEHQCEIQTPGTIIRRGCRLPIVIGHRAADEKDAHGN